MRRDTPHPEKGSPQRLAFWVAVGCFSLVACSGAVQDGGTQPTLSVPSFAFDAQPSDRVVEPPKEKFLGIEAEFAKIAQLDPAFSGYAISLQGEVEIFSTTGYLKQAARDAALAMPDLREYRAAKILDMPVAWSFLELADVRDRVRQLGVQDVYGIDLDEIANRVVVYLANSAVDRFRSKLSVLGRRSAAVQLVAASAPQLRGGLLDRQRPIVGGLGVAISALPGGYCSLGFNGIWNNTRRVVFTASHCTGRMFRRDGVGNNTTQFFQPLTDDVDDRFGSEWDDPDPFAGNGSGPCPTGALCRYTDIAAVNHVETWPGQQPPSPAAIAVPTSGPFSGNSGPISPLGTPLTVFGTWDVYPVGEQLSKVGATSGWTSGVVLRTCIDQWTGMFSPSGQPLWVLCMIETTIHSRPGDSGAPIFKYYPGDNRVYVAGILMGGPGSNYNVTWHSPMYGMAIDFHRYLVLTSP